MIHDQSQSGSTLFIEPMAVVNLNNKVKELSNEEHIEIEKILTGLSQQATAAIEDISINMDTLTNLDFIFAKAKFARSYNGSEPVFNTEGIIDIRQGRHPLLEKHTVVPVDIKLGEDYTLLIITGPNTGGKTVSLKTLGLFTLMGQAGLHIPALDGSRLAVFQDVFADIGDEQSIEQNLSTFSSHMSNIVYIVNHASPDTLCLFDEPGGGTDPVEGAALAISILSYLKGMGARCMATTHYTELKTFALSTEGVENASCEFDVATLRPTYRLMLGIPGKSNAFAISSRLGLPDYIIEQARSQIDSNAVDMETLISDLEQSRRAIEQDKADIAAYKAEIETLKQSLSEKEANLTEKKAEILRNAREEARSIIDEAKEVADSTIRDYNKWRSNPNKADLKAMEEKRSNLRKKLNDYDKANGGKKPQKTSGHKVGDFHIGDTVEVISMGVKGSIVELPDKNGNALVQMGILTSRLPISDLLIIKEDSVSLNGNGLSRKPARGNGSKSQAGTGGMNKAYTFRPEINLLGKTVDEAVSELDKFLDDAVLSHASSVTIIHGKGTGALRKGIHEYLRRQKYVRSFRAGEFGEGDAGVTIVEF
jgi:DNA mismatch repair protein MutS2